MNKQKEMTGLAPDLIIECGLLLTMADEDKPLKNVRLLIQGDRIIDIKGRDEWLPESNKCETIDAKDSLVMPGLVNSHSHAAMSIFRGYADDLPLNEWLFEKIFPAEAKYINPDTVYWGTLLACVEMIASGTTSVIDGYFYEDSAVKAIHESGLRAIISQGIIDFPAPGIPDPLKNLEVGKEFLEKWSDFSPLITPGLFCHSPMTCSDRTISDAARLCQKHSVPLQIHLSETEEEVEEIIRRTSKRPVSHLKELGILGPDLIAAHAIHLDNQEIDILAQNDTKVVHIPESNMKLSSGTARVSDMLKKGLTIGIGTDGCASNNNLDIFQEMDTAAKLGKITTMDPTATNAETVLRMATLWGAKVMRLDKVTGSIEKGKKADIIVIDMNSPHLVPLYNPVSQIVYSAKGSDVRDVIVNGRILMRDRKFLSLDLEGIMSKTRDIGRRIGGRG